MKKKAEDRKYRNTGYTYPPELEPVIRKLLDERRLSPMISKLLAQEFGVKLQGDPVKGCLMEVEAGEYKKGDLLRVGSSGKLVKIIAES